MHCIQGFYKNPQLIQLILSKLWCMDNFCTLHTQRNSSISGFNATCVLQGYLSRSTTHTVLLKLTSWPWNDSYSPAEYCGPQKGFPKRPLIFLHPKTGRSLTISQLHGGWFSQECRLEIKFFYHKVEVHSATKEWDAHIHANGETPW
jgi:hypothetical protein